MSLFDEIKNEAKEKGITMSSVEERQLEQILNRMFLLDKNIEEETKFVRHVMTRGAETQERVGLHASAITKGTDEDFCVREQVLSLLFKQNQGDNIPIKLKRIFEEGNAIHEKWQRLFIRAGYADWDQCDMTCYNDEFMISYTPDIVSFIPEFNDQCEIIVEVKSMNSWSYQKQATHAEGQKQLAWYMYLYGTQKGVVLADNKDTSEFRIEVVDYDESLVLPFIARARRVKEAYNDYLDGVKLSPRKGDMNCKKCKQCSMHDACTSTGMGRIPINANVEKLLFKRSKLSKKDFWRSRL